MRKLLIIKKQHSFNNRKPTEKKLFKKICKNEPPLLHRVEVSNAKCILYMKLAIKLKFKKKLL